MQRGAQHSTSNWSHLQLVVGQGVEREVHASAGGLALDQLLEAGAARVADVVLAQRRECLQQEGALARAAARHKHLRASKWRQPSLLVAACTLFFISALPKHTHLHGVDTHLAAAVQADARGGHAHGTSGGVDQHAVLRLQPPAHQQRIIPAQQRVRVCWDAGHRECTQRGLVGWLIDEQRVFGSSSYCPRNARPASGSAGALHAGEEEHSRCRVRHRDRGGLRKAPRGRHLPQAVPGGENARGDGGNARHAHHPATAAGFLHMHV